LGTTHAHAAYERRLPKGGSRSSKLPSYPPTLPREVPPSALNGTPSTARPGRTERKTMNTPIENSKHPRTYDYPYYSGSSGELMQYYSTVDRLQTEAPFYWNGDDTSGFWVLTDPKAVAEAYRMPELFSSASVIATDPNPDYKWIPIMSDGREHRQWRRLMAPVFAARRLVAMEDAVRGHARGIIDQFAGTGECDVRRDFGNLFPTVVFLELMGLPVEDAEQFMAWEHAILNTPTSMDPDRSIAISAMSEVTGYMTEVLSQRRAHPGDDLISLATGWEIDGKPIPHDDLLNFCLLMFIGGLDTVQAQITWSLYHLATHPSDRRRIVADPGLITTAVEEVLRVYTIVQVARKATRDEEFHGCPIKAGQMVLLPLAVLCRDPETFAESAEVNIDRPWNDRTAYAFGAGPHRCIGLDLARRELRIALEEWHQRIPDYHISDESNVIEYVGAQITLPSLPLAWAV
jgi:cytochrome P450